MKTTTLKGSITLHGKSEKSEKSESSDDIIGPKTLMHPTPKTSNLSLTYKNVLIVKVNRSCKKYQDLEPRELYVMAQGDWKLGRKKFKPRDIDAAKGDVKEINYVAVSFKNCIVEIYQVYRWDYDYSTERWSFEGVPIQFYHPLSIFIGESPKTETQEAFELATFEVLKHT